MMPRLWLMPRTQGSRTSASLCQGGQRPDGSLQYLLTTTDPLSRKDQRQGRNGVQILRHRWIGLVLTMKKVIITTGSLKVEYDASRDEFGSLSTTAHVLLIVADLRIARAAAFARSLSRQAESECLPNRRSSLLCVTPIGTLHDLTRSGFHNRILSLAAASLAHCFHHKFDIR